MVEVATFCAHHQLVGLNRILTDSRIFMAMRASLEILLLRCLKRRTIHVSNVRAIGVAKIPPSFPPPWWLAAGRDLHHHRRPLDSTRFCT